jgi:predicted O-methyltransferase YrrM
MENYIKKFIKPTNNILEKIKKTKNKKANPFSFIEEEAASFINFLIHLKKPKKMLELGTCIGYSSIFFGEKIKEFKGSLVSIEKEEMLFREAKENIEKSGLSSVIELKNENALTYIKKLKNKSIDIIFLDIKKSEYKSLINDFVRVLKKDGLLIADDTLFPIKKHIKESIKKEIHQYNKLIFSDPNFHSSIINVGDGLTLSIKNS